MGAGTKSVEGPQEGGLLSLGLAVQPQQMEADGSRSTHGHASDDLTEPGTGPSDAPQCAGSEGEGWCRHSPNQLTPEHTFAGASKSL